MLFRLVLLSLVSLSRHSRFFVLLLSKLIPVEAAVPPVSAVSKNNTVTECQRPIQRTYVPTGWERKSSASVVQSLPVCLSPYLCRLLGYASSRPVQVQPQTTLRMHVYSLSLYCRLTIFYTIRCICTRNTHIPNGNTPKQSLPPDSLAVVILLSIDHMNHDWLGITSHATQVVAGWDFHNALCNSASLVQLVTLTLIWSTASTCSHHVP